MKYIVMLLDGEEFMFIFPNHEKCVHAEMVDAVGCIKVGNSRNWEREFRGAEVVSAGFVDASGRCYGRSESLNIDSRHLVDTALFAKQMKG